MTSATFFRIARPVLLTAAGLFFLFPFVWVLLMSFMTNQDILRDTPTLAFSPTLDNYASLIAGQLKTDVARCRATTCTTCGTACCCRPRRWCCR